MVPFLVTASICITETEETLRFVRQATSMTSLSMATSRADPVPPGKTMTARAWLWALFTLNAMWVTDLLVIDGGLQGVLAPGGLLTALGRIFGLYGALLLVFQLLLIARIPWLERRLGMDQLTRWHRWTGFWVLWTLLAHVVFITLGYATTDGSPVIDEINTLLFQTPDVLKAAVAMALLIMVAVTSARAARRRMHYENWHFIHLYAYLAVVLAFFHQVSVGRDFVGSPIATAYWWTLYGVALGAIVIARILLPAWRNLRHRLRVLAVIPESPQVTSIYLVGHHLDKLPARAGQFFLWRFLTKDRWWEAHPYSLSAMPNGRTLRITVKALGEGSAAVFQLRPGTRVWLEGPYGAFTTDKRTARGALLIGGGVGITPIRALLEELIRVRDNIVVIYRVTTRQDAVLLDELKQLANSRGVSLHVIVGQSNAIGMHGPLLGPKHLAVVVPDIHQRDVFISGPAGMTDFVLAGLSELRMPRSQCHIERFAFAG